MTNDQKMDFSEQVMKEIAKRRLEIRPKWYFQVLAIAAGVVCFILWALTVIVLSIGLFRVRHVNPINFLHLGNTGLYISLQIIPWEIVAFGVLGFLLTWLLVRRFDVSYKLGYGLIILILVGGAVLAGFLLDQNKFGEQVEKSGIVPLLVRHESFGGNWVEGRITEIKNDGFELKSHTGAEISVVFSQNVKAQGRNILKKEKVVRVVGEWHGKDFVADIIEVDGADGDIE